jgi:alkylation response protein AidB-like acyl-CoA dehydrogenase
MTERPFDLPVELEEFRGLVRRIMSDKVGMARAAEIDESDEWPKDVWETFVEHGLMSIGYPEAFGAAAAASLIFAVLIEEISRVSAGVALTPLVSRLGAIP